MDGAIDGITYYVKPKFEKLGEIEVWKNAAVQIFYSLGLGFGSLITLSSYNKFDSNCYRDALIVCFVNWCTSIFAGFTVFSILGFMAKAAEQEIEDVVKSGPGLAFIVFPEAVTHIDISGVPQVMAFLFFTMLLTLGLDSMFTTVETVTTCMFDHFKQLAPYKPIVVVMTCTTFFMLGLSMCSSGGIYMFQLLDNCSASWNILLIALVELILVSWGYGADNFLNNIKDMRMKLSQPMRLYWKICWKFITPTILLSILVITFARHEKLKTVNWTFKNEEDVYVWEDGVQALGWLISLGSVLIIPLVGIYQVCIRKSKGDPINVWAMFRKTAEWKPSPDSVGLSQDNNVERKPSRRYSRISFRKNVPQNAEELD